MFGKKKRTLKQAQQRVWKCFQCGRRIRFNVDMMCDQCKNERDAS